MHQPLMDLNQQKSYLFDYQENDAQYLEKKPLQSTLTKAFVRFNIGIYKSLA